MCSSTFERIKAVRIKAVRIKAVRIKADHALVDISIPIMIF
jgi:hypothetical protein